MSANRPAPRLDYKARMLAKAEMRAGARAAADRKTYSRLARYQFTCDPPFLAALRAAAGLRGISVAGYVRRAIGTFVAADLGIPPAEVLRHVPQAAPRGKWVRRPIADPKRGATTAGRTRDDGIGFGPWVASGVAEQIDGLPPLRLVDTAGDEPGAGDVEGEISW
jgi:hypothetical protein